jgi:hypothetical protein
MTTLFFKRIIVAKYKEVKTGLNMAEFLREAMAHEGLFCR